MADCNIETENIENGSFNPAATNEVTPAPTPILINETTTNAPTLEGELNNVLPSAETQAKSKETELLDAVFTLESEKQALVEESNKRLGHLHKDLEESLSEIDKLRRKVGSLEQSLKQSVALSNGDSIKTKEQQEELLLRAKTLLFEKTKLNKHQEQQIVTLKAQVDAINAVLAVTKDMLRLKNQELETMQERLDKSAIWIKTEKDKTTLVEKKLAISQGLYEKLRSEYDTQAIIFKSLKEAYEQKISVLSSALETAKSNM